MQDFINLTIKTVNDLAMLPSVFGKVFGNKINSAHRFDGDVYGGFTKNDWVKVGSDMKRGLISFGKAK